VSFTAEISRSSPTALLFVVDQSTSMRDRLQTEKSKSQFLTDVLNRTLYTLITTCSKADGVRDYFYVGVIGYSGVNARNGFQGDLAKEAMHPISRIADAPLRIETRMKRVMGANDSISEEPVKFPIWFDPQNRGKTSMCAGLRAAYDLMRSWCSEHQMAYPPTILHITDGHPTDGNPEPVADEIKSLATDDGPCLLFNLHVDVGNAPPRVFPHDEGLIHDRFGKTLFRMSSDLPSHAAEVARKKGRDIRPGAKGFVFNAGLEEITDFFDIGTRPAKLDDR
jgi:hypothetical protein